ncbi:flagellar hook capping protein [bacterium]|nr:flagellar hook capping protein [bacterium]
MAQTTPIQSSLEPTYEPKKRKPTTELGKDEFLQLMIAQIQHQDPLEPMDNSESIAQQAQFSSLEQMQNLNTSMESLLTAYQSSEKSSALSMIGKQVEGFISTTDGDGKSVTSTVTGKVKGVDLTSAPPLIIVISDGEETRIPQNQINSVTLATTTPPDNSGNTSPSTDDQENNETV